MTAQPKPAFEAEREHTLHSKLVQVMAAIDWIKKGGSNEVQHYKYARQADVVDAVRAELVKVKVTCLPTNIEVVESRDFESKGGGRQHFLLIRTEWTFTDAETGETLTVISLGGGTDSGDKAPYKAMTGASKYAELLSFLIPTGDDPEKEPKPGREPQQRPAPTPIRSATKAPDLDEEDAAELFRQSQAQPDEKPWDYAAFREAVKASGKRPELAEVAAAGSKLFPTKGLELHEPKAWDLHDREWRQLAVTLGVIRP